MLKLDELRTPDNKLVSLKADDEITYWLEATDNFDFGNPNVGKSKTFKITIQDGLQPSMQQKQQRQQAQKVKDQIDNQQSKDQEKQNDDQNQKGSGKEQSKDGSNQNGAGKDDGKGNDQSKGDGQSKDDKAKGNGSKDNGAGQSGNDNQPSPQEQKKTDLENKLAKTAGPINEALDQDNADKSPPDASKENKGDNQNGSNKDQSKENPGSEKNPNPGKANPKDGGGEKNPDKNDPGNKEKSGKEGSGQDNQPKTGSKDDPGAKKADDKKGGSEAGGNSSDKEKAGNKDPNKGNNDAGGGKSGSQQTPDTAGKDGPKKGSPGKVDDPNAKGKPTDQKGNPDIAQKGKTSDKAKSEVAKKPPEGQPRPGEAKGNDPKNDVKGEAKGEAKAANGKDDPAAEAKAKAGKPGDPGSAKEPPSKDKADEIALAKDNGSTEGTKTPTKEDVDALKDLLKKGGPEADRAAKEMAKKGQDIKDPGLKKDLEDALRDAGQKDALDELTGQNRELLPPPQAAGTGAKEQGTAPKDDPTQKTGNEASPQTKTGGKGLIDELNKITPEEAFARRMGNLQLDNIEDLKKRVTPDVLKRGQRQRRRMAVLPRQRT